MLMFPCPMDTNNDNDCGRPLCPWCGQHPQRRFHDKISWDTPVAVRQSDGSQERFPSLQTVIEAAIAHGLATRPRDEFATSGDVARHAVTALRRQLQAAGLYLIVEETL